MSKSIVDGKDRLTLLLTNTETGESSQIHGDLVERDLRDPVVLAYLVVELHKGIEELKGI